MHFYYGGCFSYWVLSVSCCCNYAALKVTTEPQWHTTICFYYSLCLQVGVGGTSWSWLGVALLLVSLILPQGPAVSLGNGRNTRAQATGASSFQASSYVVCSHPFGQSKSHDQSPLSKYKGKYIFAGRNCNIMWQRAWILRGVKN